ncbi:class I SAM-dependent methyltransferase [Azospirillum sp.]|uniref:class I SAM-dependent methyltransferase n=1 Tax=Azospirillum sp. TaxID=34012 RepID=UPI003D7486B1
MYTLEDALKIAFEHENAGRFAIATEIFRSVLTVAPSQPVAESRLREINGKLEVLRSALRFTFPGEPVPPGLVDALTHMFRLERDLPSGHKQPGYLVSTNDERGRPNDRLLDLVMSAFPLARRARFDSLDARQVNGERWYRFWPGEHYALIVGLLQVLKPRIAIEIGTFTGMATLVMAENMPADGRVFTFDIVDWRKIDNSWLCESDFAGKHTTQILADLSRPAKFEEHRALIEQADFIFIDGPKDHHTEKSLLALLDSVTFKTKPIIMFDDTKLLNMVDIWHQLDRPKLDVTSFGHWSGTGLVDWCG